jgi:hypothetical protein
MAVNFELFVPNFLSNLTTSTLFLHWPYFKMLSTIFCFSASTIIRPLAERQIMLRKERDHFATVKVVSNKKRENIDPKLAKVLKTKGKRKLNVQVTEEDD